MGCFVRVLWELYGDAERGLGFIRLEVSAEHVGAARCRDGDHDNTGLHHAHACIEHRWEKRATWLSATMSFPHPAFPRPPEEGLAPALWELAV
jgi:hypothetical protein